MYYWRLKSIPELRDLTRADRSRVWRAAIRDPFRASDLGRLVVILAAIALVVYVDFKVEAVAGNRWGLVFLLLVIFAFEPLVVFPILARRYRPVIQRLRGTLY